MKQGIVYTTNLSNLKKVNEDDSLKHIQLKLFTARVPIENLEKYKLEHIKQLSPSSGLLYRYKEDKINWYEYVKCFRKEMMNMQKYLNRIEERLQEGKDVLLICYCSSNKCHNRILSNYFVDLGFKHKNIT